LGVPIYHAADERKPDYPNQTRRFEQFGFDIFDYLTKLYPPFSTGMRSQIEPTTTNRQANNISISGPVYCPSWEYELQALGIETMQQFLYNPKVLWHYFQNGENISRILKPLGSVGSGDVDLYNPQYDTVPLQYLSHLHVDLMDTNYQYRQAFVDRFSQDLMSQVNLPTTDVANLTSNLNKILNIQAFTASYRSELVKLFTAGNPTVGMKHYITSYVLSRWVKLNVVMDTNGPLRIDLLVSCILMKTMLKYSQVHPDTVNNVDNYIGFWLFQILDDSLVKGNIDLNNPWQNPNLLVGNRNLNLITLYYNTFTPSVLLADMKDFLLTDGKGGGWAGAGFAQLNRNQLLLPPIGQTSPSFGNTNYPANLEYKRKFYHESMSSNPNTFDINKVDIQFQRFQNFINILANMTGVNAIKNIWNKNGNLSGASLSDFVNTLKTWVGRSVSRAYAINYMNEMMRILSISPLCFQASDNSLDNDVFSKVVYTDQDGVRKQFIGPMKSIPVGEGAWPEMNVPTDDEVITPLSLLVSISDITALVTQVDYSALTIYSPDLDYLMGSLMYTAELGKFSDFVWAYQGCYYKPISRGKVIEKALAAVTDANVKSILINAFSDESMIGSVAAGKTRSQLRVPYNPGSPFQTLFLATHNMIINNLPYYGVATGAYFKPNLAPLNDNIFVRNYKAVKIVLPAVTAGVYDWTGLYKAWQARTLASATDRAQLEGIPVVYDFEIPLINGDISVAPAMVPLYDWKNNLKIGKVGTYDRWLDKKSAVDSNEFSGVPFPPVLSADTIYFILDYSLILSKFTQDVILPYNGRLYMMSNYEFITGLEAAISPL